jgi:DNA-binding transcriptional regulator YiaG
MEFSEKVKFVRAILLITQKELANSIGVSNITICRWETQGLKPTFLDEKRFEAFVKQNGINFGDII